MNLSHLWILTCYSWLLLRVETWVGTLPIAPHIAAIMSGNYFYHSVILVSTFSTCSPLVQDTVTCEYQSLQWPGRPMCSGTHHLTDLVSSASTFSAALLSPQLPACLPTQQACCCLRALAYASLFPGVSSSNISTLCILTFLRSLLTHTGFSVGCSLISLLSTFSSSSFPALSFFRVFLTTWCTISLIFLFCCCLSPSLGCELHEDRDSFSLLFCAVHPTPGTAPGN